MGLDGNVRLATQLGAIAMVPPCRLHRGERPVVRPGRSKRVPSYRLMGLLLLSDTGAQEELPQLGWWAAVNLLQSIRGVRVATQG